MKKRVFLMALLLAVSAGALAQSPRVEEMVRTKPRYDNARPGDLVEAIVAQYPGRTVLVDFWATWCVPCLRAALEMEPMKPWIEEQGIVKVYLCAWNSDPVLWVKFMSRINPYSEGGVEGEHYWLSREEWDATREKHGSTGVPTYLIYNKQGEKVFSRVGYPGNDAMKAELEKAL